MKTLHFEANINDDYHFKEISEDMEEFLKTHIIVPPYEDDPPYIAGRIVKKEDKNVYKRRQSN